MLLILDQYQKNHLLNRYQVFDVAKNFLNFNYFLREMLGIIAFKINKKLNFFKKSRYIYT